MLGVTDLPTYLAGLALIILLPGPNSLYVLSVAARRGVRTGYTAAAGVFCGDTVLMTLSAAGVASLLQANPLLFGLVKYAGAGYLTYLAFGMVRTARALWRDRSDRAAETGGTPGTAGATEAAAGTNGSAAGTNGPAQAARTADEQSSAPERPYRRALVVSLFNPKAILFFISFFVQFVDPHYAYPALSFVVLGGLAQLASFLYLTLLIFGGTRLAAAFRRRRRLSAGVTSAAGALFLGFAVKLSLSSV
ncbi:leucine efflux protein LeuE [Streptomyces sp. NBC_01089]|uniref:leucine efflux protein LeuE n=1 Tax=Streptomyces sp. NBC_01089 TaxID=2903747 RepID=UPI0038695889|nr:leucine efflux protein LeuE [Streptomyces sp. NBC_01089]